MIGVLLSRKLEPTAFYLFFEAVFSQLESEFKLYAIDEADFSGIV